MSGYARSRVDLHVTQCRELAQLVIANGSSNALLTSFCLQFELAIGFYAVEVLQAFGKKGFKAPWPLAPDSFRSLADQFDVAELHELKEISAREESWLAKVLQRLGALRRHETARVIKGDIFQSDLDAPTKPANLIATTSGSTAVSFDIDVMLAELDEFEGLLGRQRLGYEEY